jgi:hypothetical protein
MTSDVVTQPLMRRRDSSGKLPRRSRQIISGPNAIGSSNRPRIARGYVYSGELGMGWW